MGAIVVTWVPPRVGATKVTLGGTKATCGCQWGCVGATKCGCHQGHIGWYQGHMWGPPSVGATKVTCG